MAEQCCTMKPPKKSKLPPGQQKWTRCRNRADLNVSIHSESTHAKVGTGWFCVPMCDDCFKRQESA